MTDLVVVVNSEVIQKLKDKKTECKRLTASGVCAWALKQVLKENSA